MAAPNYHDSLDAASLLLCPPWLGTSGALAAPSLSEGAQLDLTWLLEGAEAASAPAALPADKTLLCTPRSPPAAEAPWRCLDPGHDLSCAR
jgi:hypothetical protein